MQHIKSLDYFVTVAQHKSIREAAEVLHLSSSALNRQILDLEDELGAQLFERHARGVRLSAAGEAYLVYAKQALRDAELVQSHINALQGLRRGHISLSAVAAIADERLMDLIVRFQRTYPQIGFTLTVVGAERVVDAVLENDADLGLVFNSPSQHDFHELASRKYSIHAVVTQDHLLAKQDAVSIFSLQEYPMALGDHSWGGRRLLEEYLHKTGLKLQPQLVSNSFDAQTRFIRMTQGVCLQIRPGSQVEQMDGDLVAIPIKELKKYQRVMVLGSLRGRALPVAAALFSEILKKELFMAEQA